MEEKKDLLEKAKLAEQAERYADMAAKMKALAEKYPQFGVEERNLLSVAYKNVVGPKRSAWRILSSIEQKDEKDSTSLKEAGDYRKEIADELNTVCREVLVLLDDYLIKQNQEVDSQVFYLKMKGDYHRYLAEVADEDQKKSTIDDSEKAYTEAFKLSKDQMSPTHPIHLGLALNFSVFYYEIANKPEEACNLAKDAYEKASEDVQNSQNPEHFKDSTLIMHLLNDNLTLWRSDAQVGEGGEEEDLNN